MWKVTMSRRRKTVSSATVATVVILAAGALCAFAYPDHFAFLARAGQYETRPAALSYSDYGAVLVIYVDDRGMVDYRLLKTNRGQLDEFCDAMAKPAQKMPNTCAAASSRSSTSVTTGHSTSNTPNLRPTPKSKR